MVYLATFLGTLGHTDRALCELNRCLDDGFILYRLLSSDPNRYPAKRAGVLRLARARGGQVSRRLRGIRGRRRSAVVRPLKTRTSRGVRDDGSPLTRTGA